MNSPVKNKYSQIIRLHRGKKDPIYLQIVYQLIQGIQRGLLSDGEQLPGSRVLASTLGVHRQTIVSAMNELAAQGWIEIKSNIGAFVKYKKEINEEKRKSKIPESSIFSFRKSFVFDQYEKHVNFPFVFDDGQPDYRLISIEELSRFYRNSLQRKSVFQQFIHSSRENVFFTKQLSYYLNLTRNFHISNAELGISSNKEILLYVLSQLLIEKGNTVLVAEKSYYVANMLFRQAGATMKTIPVDEEGIDVEYIRQHFKKGEIRCIYLQTQHAYPTTQTMSKKRRIELLNLSLEYEFIILEDDDSFEFSFTTEKIPSLFQNDSYGNVVYLSSFGSFLSPNFQRYFMISSPDFILEAQKYLRIFNRSDVVMDQALGEMIQEGDIHRYRRKAVQTYQGRNAYFYSLLKELSSPLLSFVQPDGGFGYWIAFTESVSLKKVRELFTKEGLYLPRVCCYQDAQTTAIRIGYARFQKEEMKDVVSIIKKIVDHFS